jgi:hypothetical protein
MSRSHPFTILKNPPHILRKVLNLGNCPICSSTLLLHSVTSRLHKSHLLCGYILCGPNPMSSLSAGPKTSSRFLREAGLAAMRYVMEDQIEVHWLHGLWVCGEGFWVWDWILVWRWAWRACCCAWTWACIAAMSACGCGTGAGG